MDDVLFGLASLFSWHQLPLVLKSILFFQMDLVPTDGPPLISSGCWSCGTVMLGSEQSLVCIVCNATSILLLPPLISPPVPIFSSSPGSVHENSVSAFLHHRFSQLPPTVARLVYDHLRAWARIIKAKFARSLRHGRPVFSPLVVHGHFLLVFQRAQVLPFVHPKYPPWSPAPALFLISPTYCTKCGRPPLSQTYFCADSCGVAKFATCVCESTLEKVLASRSHCSHGDVDLGHVIPVQASPTSGLSPCPSVPRQPLWESLWQTPPAAAQAPLPSGGIRILSLNCGGPASHHAELLSLLLSCDPDFAFLQEMWDFSLRQEVCLQPFHIIESAITGPGRGLQVLIHRRLCPTKSHLSVLFDCRHWFALIVQALHQAPFLLINVHLDPHLSTTEKEQELSHMAALLHHVRVPFSFVAGDFNIPRTPNSLLSRLLQPGGCLGNLHIPYPAGTPTNFSTRHGVPSSTEIDYILVPRTLTLSQKCTIPGLTSHSALSGVLNLPLNPQETCPRRYKHPACTPDARTAVAVLLGIFWWWLKFHTVHPDAWIFCYWFLADTLLIPFSRSFFMKDLLSRTPVFSPHRPTFNQNQLDQWWIALRQKLFLHGLRLPSEVLSSAAITTHTSRLVRPVTKKASPYPELLPNPSHTHPSRSASLLFAASELREYHSSRGVCMDLPRLIFLSQAGLDSVTTDDPSFSSLYQVLPHSSWHCDTRSRSAWCALRQKSPIFSASALSHAARFLHSPAVSVDDLPASLLRLLPWSGFLALESFIPLLSCFPHALSNCALQLGIFKRGPKHLFTSYRPIKLGSAINRLEGSVVHHETMLRAELDGSFAGPTFSYRKEISPHFLALSLRAALSMSLSTYGEAHLIDGDESGAFDRPVREDIAVLSKTMDSQCDFGSWAASFYSRQKVRLWTSNGLAPPVSSEEGFSQGCSLSATAYLVVGSLRTRALRGLTEGWCPEPRLPLCEFIFSDDRRWLGRTAEEAARIATAALSLAQDACAPNNAAKLVYTHLVLDDRGAVVAKHSSVLLVLGSPVHSVSQPPVVVGLSLFPAALPPAFFASFQQKASKLKKFIDRFTPPFVLASRCLIAFLLSPLDYQAKASSITSPTAVRLQRVLSSVFRRLLHSSHDVPISVLTTPIQGFGWGCPSISIRCDLNFLQGYILALSCRSVFVRRVLQLQATTPLPHGQDDASHFHRLLSLYNITPLPFPTQDLSLPLIPPSLLSSPVLYITTDAGLEVPGTPLQACRAGLGVVIADSNLRSHHLRWGLSTVCASSTHIEWLARLCVLFLLKDFPGTIVLFCDNAAVQFKCFTQRVRCAGWLDFFARHVLQLPVCSRLVEYWLPAQHDSGHTSLSAQWQALADSLCTDAIHAQEDSLPLSAFLGSLGSPCPPFVPLFHGGVVFHLNKLFSALHCSVCEARSPLSAALSSLPLGCAYDASHWASLCSDPAIPLSLHRCAFTLRSTVVLPRIFDLVPECRFCNAPCGAHPGHWPLCPSLYARLCRAFQEALRLLIASISATLHEVRDLVAVFSHSSRSFLFLLSSEFEAPQKIRHFLSHFSCPFILITWSGLFGCSTNLPLHIPPSLRQTLSITVLKNMSHPAEFASVPSSLLPSAGPHLLHPSPSPCSVPLRSQQILAWFLRIDPRCHVAFYPYQFDIPVALMDPSATRFISVQVCTLNLCLASLPPPSDPCVTLCCCTTPCHPEWQVVLCGADFALLASQRYTLPHALF